ncbi:hypothetical protein HMN09_00566000 [Mycena chlorophos]|uniref:Methyltransferase domain-containing protein n=1 Tax=Mycena chlorophos TaxID=658473 RepID=A0A8H6TAS5_MYCCL|nr:hypothetical protein HMN09_00566000 [Mycena chlorophos]
MSRPTYIPPLDVKLSDVLEVDGDTGLQFFQKEIGISDANELEKHVLALQAKAYEMFPYTCIRVFSFMRVKTSLMPAYPRVVEVMKQNPDALFLDIGCFFGTDVRKLVVDGVSPHQVVATDILQGFWDLGHELFKSTPATFPVKFLQGDVFDPAFLPPPAQDAAALSSKPVLADLTSLTPLRGHLTAIHITYVFHLFPEEKQRLLAEHLAGMLSAASGSTIFGATFARRTPGRELYFRDEAERLAALSESQDTSNAGEGKRQNGVELYCFSPESWTALWESFFPPGAVRVETKVTERAAYSPGEMIPVGKTGDDVILNWSCTRV